MGGLFWLQILRYVIKCLGRYGGGLRSFGLGGVAGWSGGGCRYGRLVGSGGLGGLVGAAVFLFIFLIKRLRYGNLLA